MDSTFAALQDHGLKFDMHDLAYAPAGTGSRASGTESSRSLSATSDASGVEVIGKGSMGVIYKASLRVRNCVRDVAVKQLHDCDRNSPTGHEQLQALLREMMLGMQVKPHPNVIEFIGAIKHPSHGALLVLELIDGIDMEQYFEQHQAQHQDWRPQLDEALEWGRQVYSALDHLHTGDVQLMHRDVKPSNLMLFNRTVDSFESVKLIDFGLARADGRGERSIGQFDSFEWQPLSHFSERVQASLRDADLEALDMTARVGTHRYMAPEIVKGVCKYSAKVDVYSATMVLYFLVTGERPFKEVAAYDASQLTALQGKRPSLESIKSPAVRELLILGWQEVTISDMMLLHLL
jgi:serine/threonine protein kinase